MTTLKNIVGCTLVDHGLVIEAWVDPTDGAALALCEYEGRLKMVTVHDKELVPASRTPTEQPGITVVPPPMMPGVKVAPNVDDGRPPNIGRDDADHVIECFREGRHVPLSFVPDGKPAGMEINRILPPQMQGMPPQQGPPFAKILLCNRCGLAYWEVINAP